MNANWNLTTYIIIEHKILFFQSAIRFVVLKLFLPHFTWVFGVGGTESHSSIFKNAGFIVVVIIIRSSDSGTGFMR